MPSTSPTPRDLVTPKALPILARSLFREMRQQGYSKEQIITFSTELIGLVNEDLQQQPQEHLAAE